MHSYTQTPLGRGYSPYKPEEGGKPHLRLNWATRPIANKVCSYPRNLRFFGGASILLLITFTCDRMRFDAK
uniref:Uncharacterized protein n=1 Tax=Setaria digitata TaxID=48799 RepID=A0A915PMH4_9BILA